MGLNFNGSPPAMGGKVIVEIPTPTYSGKATSDPEDSKNPYTTEGPGPGGEGQTDTEIEEERNPSGSGDEYYDNVSLLLKFDGADGTNTFVDDSLNELSPTLFGTPTISTDQAKFGTSSGKFGVVSTYLSYIDEATNMIGLSGDFTYDMWAYSPTLNSGTHVLIYSGIPADSNSRLGWFLQPGVMGIAWSGAGVQSVSATSADNAWTHLALVQSGSTVYRFVNGIKAADYTHTFNNGREAGDDVFIGGHIPTSQPVVAPDYMDHVRITPGVARWTANFTPPTESEY